MKKRGKQHEVNDENYVVVELGFHGTLVRFSETAKHPLTFSPSLDRPVEHPDGKRQPKLTDLARKSSESRTLCLSSRY